MLKIICNSIFGVNLFYTKGFSSKYLVFSCFFDKHSGKGILKNQIDLSHHLFKFKYANKSSHVGARHNLKGNKLSSILESIVKLTKLEWKYSKIETVGWQENMSISIQKYKYKHTNISIQKYK